MPFDAEVLQKVGDQGLDFETQILQQARIPEKIIVSFLLLTINDCRTYSTYRKCFATKWITSENSETGISISASLQ